MPRTSLAALATLAVAAVPAPAWSTPPPTGAPAAGASSCQVLHASKKLRRTLRRLHVRSLDRSLSRPFKVTGPRGRVYNGRCGSTHYALATFSHTIGGTFLGTQDQPERFRRKAGRSWRDLGDTGGDVCSGVAPRALIRLWGFDCVRGAS